LATPHPWPQFRRNPRPPQHDPLCGRGEDRRRRDPPIGMVRA